MGLPQVLNLLLLDGTNPQSLAFAIQKLEDSLATLPNAFPDNLREEQRAILKLSTTIRLASEEELTIEHDEMYYRLMLDEFLGNIWESLFLVSNTIIQTYFRHTNFDQQPPLFGKREES